MGKGTRVPPISCRSTSIHTQKVRFRQSTVGKTTETDNSDLEALLLCVK